MGPPPPSPCLPPCPPAASSPMVAGSPSASLGTQRHVNLGCCDNGLPWAPLPTQDPGSQAFPWEPRVRAVRRGGCVNTVSGKQRSWTQGPGWGGSPLLIDPTFPTALCGAQPQPSLPPLGQGALKGRWASGLLPWTLERDSTCIWNYADVAISPVFAVYQQGSTELWPLSPGVQCPSLQALF